MNDIEAVFREEVMRRLKLNQVDRSMPQAAFFKFYGPFKIKYGAGSLGVGEWKNIFLDVLKKTPPSFPNIKPVSKKPRLRLIVTKQKPVSRVIVSAGRFMERSQPPGDR